MRSEKYYEVKPPILIISTFILIICLGFFMSAKPISNNQADRAVYICTDIASYKYHYDKNCLVLLKCSKSVVRTNEDTAVRLLGLLKCDKCVKDTTK